MGVLSLLLGAAGQPAHALTRNEYDALIIQARNGEYEPALAMLREHSQQYPHDLRAAYDRALIASWARRPAETIAAYEALTPTPNHPPADVLATVAAAYRDTRQWDKSLVLYRDGRRLYPRHTAFAVGEIKVLADAGRGNEALAAAQAAARQWPESEDIALAQAYAARGAHTADAALQHTTRAAALAPGKRYVTREYIHALRDAGLPGPALREARVSPGSIDAATVRVIWADRAAELTRLAVLPSMRESDRFALADQALALYDKLIPEWQALGEPARAELNRARADRLHALHARARREDVVAGYEAMRAEGTPIPRHVLGDVADAYLAVRRPEEAVALYQLLLSDESPPPLSAHERVSAQTGLYYALQESERYEEADDVIEQAVSEQPKWVRLKGQPSSQPNELYLYAAHTQAVGQYYARDAEGAEQRVRTLLQTAPNNSTLRGDLAMILLGREQPRAAERELKMAEAMTPRAVQLEVDQANTAIALREYRQAELLVADVTARNPENGEVQRLARVWEVHNKAELRVTANHDIATDSPVSGSGDTGIDTVVYTAPIDQNWRGFAGGGYAQAEFEEGKSHYRWMRGGVEWRGRDLKAELDASANSYGHGVKTGFRASVDVDLNDHWQIGASAEFRSRATPLRALLANISSNRAEFRIGWHANEGRAWQLALAPSHFSDGNNRVEYSLHGRERLFASPRLQTDLELEFSGSHNSQEGGPYFNPRADLFVLPALAFTHTLYRRYDTSLEQRFMIGAGIYAQRGFSSGAVGAIGYGLRYRSNQVLDVGASVVGISRPYDGVREREVRIMFDMNLRF
ncbi:poly-beta-1,6 N-acetyl-D-glucosamine export porin PgaA [Pusillimonas sp. TS35]|nr:poly-beta-1,6 N-acetyl-D-glucosamine export porin PgaA [Pusillimonas sp. TS35]